jgi:hypothetical protein
MTKRQHTSNCLCVTVYFIPFKKKDFCLEPYFLRIDQQYRKCITKFRVSNMKLPIETDRWYNISKDHRKYLASTILNKLIY